MNKPEKKQSKILPSISYSGPTFSSLNTSVSTYKGVTPNHWKKCIYALGLVFRLVVLNSQVVFFFAKPTKALIVMKNFNVGRLSLSAWSVRQFNKHLVCIYANPTRYLQYQHSDCFLGKYKIPKQEN